MLKRYQANLIGKDATRVKLVAWKNSLNDICDILESNQERQLEPNEMVVAKEYKVTGTRSYVCDNRIFYCLRNDALRR